MSDVNGVARVQPCALCKRSERRAENRISETDVVRSIPVEVGGAGFRHSLQAML
ncbi:MAG: hypothetical protein Kow0026_18940 [Oricola sp.]